MSSKQKLNALTFTLKNEGVIVVLVSLTVAFSCQSPMCKCWLFGSQNFLLLLLKIINIKKKSFPRKCNCQGLAPRPELLGGQPPSGVFSPWMLPPLVWASIHCARTAAQLPVESTHFFSCSVVCAQHNCHGDYLKYICHFIVLLSSNILWLPIGLRIKSKILTMASKALHDLPGPSVPSVMGSVRPSTPAALTPLLFLSPAELFPLSGKLFLQLFIWLFPSCL